MFALLFLGCDAAEEERGPGVYPTGLTTTSTTTTDAMTGETTSSGAQDSATTDDSTTTGTSAASTSSTSATTLETSTGGEATTDATTTTTGDATTTTGDTTTGGDPPCPCLPQIQAGQNLCNAQPTPECPATLPGGLCDPNGDGSYADADWIAGYQGFLDACG